MEKVSKKKVINNLKRTVDEAVKPLGGFNKIINEGDVVFIKPNFNTADSFPASTDLEFLRVVTELVYQAGAKMVMIGESSTMSMNTRKIMEEIGVFELQEMKKPPRIYVFEEEKWGKVSIPNAKYLKNVTISTIHKRADRLIYLPCLKTHMYAQFTGALKLSVGFMKPFERLALHMRNIQEKIAELNTLFQPDLVIMDARKCFINRGPSEGELKEPNVILASKGRTAIDAEGIRIIQNYPGNSLKGIDPKKLPQIEKAMELGIK